MTIGGRWLFDSAGRPLNFFLNSDRLDRGKLELQKSLLHPSTFLSVLRPRFELEFLITGFRMGQFHMAASPIDRSVRIARSRLLRQSFVNNLGVCWLAALGLIVVWFIAQPMLIETPPASLRWIVLGSGLALGFIAAVWRTRSTAPTAEHAALEIDNRFQLRERITTAVALPPELRNTSAGQALFADAENKLAPLNVSEKFPLAPRRHLLGVPALGLALAALAMWWNPVAMGLTQTDEEKAAAQKIQDQTVAAQTPTKKKSEKPKAAVEAPPERPNKGKGLKDLEEELAKAHDKFAKDPFEETAEKQREKAAELAQLETKTQKFVEEKHDQLQELKEQFQKLDKLNMDKEFEDGPAKDFNDALSKGDLKKAKEEIDELKKKAKDKKLDEKDQEKLERQLDKIKKELERLDRDKQKVNEEKKKEREEKKKELEKEIDKAKQENKDASELEREREKIEKQEQTEREAGEQLKDLANNLGGAQKGLEEKDLEKVAEELEKAGKGLEKIEGEVQDFQEAESQLQKLKEERREAAGQGEKGQKGEKGQGQGEGEPMPGEGTEPGQKKKGPGTSGGIGAGQRPINDDAKTNSQDEKIRSPFDPDGKKTFAGSTRGPAFTKKTEAELGKEIQQRAQEAPAGADAQRLPRDARDSVKEYFEKLGGTGTKK